jgi:hypothetical protein
MEADLVLAVRRAVASVSTEWLTLKAAISMTTPLGRCVLAPKELDLHVFCASSTFLSQNRPSETHTTPARCPLLQGGGVFVDGTLTMTTSRLEANRGFVQGANLYLGAGSTTTYVLPAPPGYWVPATRCEVWREACPSSDRACQAAAESCKDNLVDNVDNCNRSSSSSCQPTTFNQPCDWRNNPALFDKTVYVLPLGPHDLDYPYACQVGQYCPEGSVVGKLCPPGSTTDGRGATSEDDCGCSAGSYDAAHPLSGHHYCLECTEGMNCTVANTGTQDLPVAAGYWRQHYWSAPPNGSLSACFTVEACLGGANLSADAFCAPSQQGPYCAVCRDGYFGGGDGVLCEPCEGHAVITILPVVLIGIAFLAVLAYVIVSCRRGDNILGILAGESSKLAEAVATELEDADALSTLDLRLLPQSLTQPRLQSRTRPLRPQKTMPKIGPSVELQNGWRRMISRRGLRWRRKETRRA